MLLIRLKSVHRRMLPSGFLTGTIGEDHGLWEGLRIPCSTNVCTSSRS